MYVTFLDYSKGCKVTYSTANVTEQNLAYANSINELLVSLCDEAQKLLAEGVENKYSTYYKTKSDGRKRRIDAPNKQLKEYMRKVVKTFTSLSNFLFPDCMYAYIHGKNTKKLAYIHKDARIVIKMDIEEFFNSCTYEFIMDSMSQVYPFCLLNWDLLIPIIQACMLNGVLAQGAPTSPLLSNIAMIPFVYEANQYAQNKSINRVKEEGEYGIVYNRKILNVVFSIYADDIIISLSGTSNIHYSQRASIVVKKIQDLLNELTPLRLNHKKIKIAKIWKSNGVWITGLMINKNHQVTIGHENKQKLKATIFSFLADVKNGNPWDEQRVRQMMGKVSYWRYIEPEYVDMIIQKYNIKLDMDYYVEIGNIIYS